MSAEELNAAVDLDLRLRSRDGTFTVEARNVDLSGEGGSIPEAARVVMASASEEVRALGPIAERGILMAPGVRRLARLRALLPLLSRLVAPEGGK